MSFTAHYLDRIGDEIGYVHGELQEIRGALDRLTYVLALQAVRKLPVGTHAHAEAERLVADLQERTRR